MELLREVATGPDRALVIVTHDARIFGFADRIARMDDGKILEIVRGERATAGAALMIRKYVLPLIAAVVGLAFADLQRGARQPADPGAAAGRAEPAPAPFASYVAGAGIIEASTREHRHRHAGPGHRHRGAVKVGDVVRPATCCSRSTIATLRAQRAAARAGARRARRRLRACRGRGRPPQAAASLAESVADDKRALSAERPDQPARDARTSAQSQEVARRTRESRADRAMVGADSSRIEQVDRRRAVDGSRARALASRAGSCTVLQVNVPGEFAAAGVDGTPLVLLGDQTSCTCASTSTRTTPGASRPARRRARSCAATPTSTTPLHFVRVEPYVVPKRSLTGDSSERVDTRVLQVIYSFDPKAAAGLRRPADGRVHRGARSAGGARAERRTAK